MLRLRSLGSGSTGNATLVEAGTQRLLVDCGLGPRVLKQRLATAGLELRHIDGIFITHEHSDHVGCAHRIATEHRIPVWMSEGTWRASGALDYQGLLNLTGDGQTIDWGELELRVFAVPHDAREPLQLCCSDGAHALGVLTDLGHVPPSVREQISGCHTLLLECNHDRQLLADSSYPVFLKKRVGGDLGHLANEQAVELASQLQGGPLRQVIAAHLSLKNNRPDLARAALRSGLGDAVAIEVADAQSGTPWITVG
ncbi:MAG: MBL fold metallo-hydrolase [Betaproteobacteria bacterium]